VGQPIIADTKRDDVAPSAVGVHVATSSNDELNAIPYFAWANRRPGAMRVWIPTGTRKSIRVPAASVIARGQMETVFVAANGQAHLRIVRTGKRSDDQLELLAGIDPGESIITEGAEQLRDGQPIAVQP
jgi:hypothetical protein